MAMLSSEEFWGCKLDAKNRKNTWICEEDDTAEHKLIVSQACLGAEAKNGERNIVAVTVTNDDDDESSQSHTILSMCVGILEQCSISIGFTSTVTFELVSGSGPVHLVGSHLLAIEDDIDEDSQMLDDSHDIDLEKSSDLSEDDDDDDGDDDDDDDDDDLSDNDDIEDLGSADGPVKRKKLNENAINTKKTKTVGSSILKKSAGNIDEDSDEDMDDDSMDDSDDELPKNKKQNDTGKSNKKVSFSNKLDVKTIPSKQSSDKNVDLEKVKSAIMKMKTKPKTLEKLRNFVKSTHKITDPAAVAEIWKSIGGK